MPDDEKMNIDERRKYLKLVVPRYAKVGRKGRGDLLTEMVEVTGVAYPRENRNPDKRYDCFLRFYFHPETQSGYALTDATL